MKKIAIIGSTGMCGKPVAQAFIQAGFEVTLLVRNEAKAKTIFGAQAHIIEGDIKDKEKLKTLLQGQEYLYLNLSVEQDSKIDDFQAEREGLQNILQIAREANIKRVGYLSSLVQFYTGIDWWVLDIKREAVQKIKNSGIPYSLFYPSTFMESIDKVYRQGNSINLAGASKYPMYLIAGADYGKQVVKAFQIDNVNHEYVVQGEEAFTVDVAAKLFVENYTKSKVKVSKLPYGVLKFLGLFSRKLHYVSNIVYVLNNNPEKFEAEKTWQTLGKPETKYIDYIKNTD
jgi:hypothetical protein